MALGIGLPSYYKPASAKFPMRNTVLLVFLILNSFAYAQQAGSRVMHYTLKDGLSFGVVNAVTQDNSGIMWIATGDGLNRFDGAAFEVYKFEPDNEYSIASNYVQTVFKDSKGVIWVSSRNGLNEFDARSKRFIKHGFNSNSRSSERIDVNNISESRNRNLWISTSGNGFSYFDKRTKSFLNYNTWNLPQLADNFVLNVLEDSKGLLWVGTADKGLSVFKIKEGYIPEKTSVNTRSIPRTRVNYIYEDHLQNVWAATSKGLILYKRKENKFYTILGEKYKLRSNCFLSVLETDNRQLLIGLQDGGIYKADLSRLQDIDPEKLVFEQVRGGDNYNITQRSVQALFQDKDKNIWVGTYGGGIYMISSIPEKFRKFQKKAHNEYGESYVRYYGMCLDEEGNIWLGTDGDGIYKSTVTGRVLKHYKADRKKGSITDNAILYAYKDRGNRLWFGTYSKGLFLYNKASDSFQNFSYDPAKKNSLSANDVRVIFEDSQNRLWVGTNGGGLCLFYPQTKQFSSYNVLNSGIGSNDVRAVIEDKAGNLWIGMYGGGLTYFDTGQKKSLPHFQHQENYLPGNVVFSLHLDSKERLWIGTEGDGLIVYDTRSKKVIKKFTEKNGLANNTVYAIKSENSEEIWVSTNKGLSKINFETGAVYNYDESDGLQGGQFNEGSAVISADGKFMCFGGTEGWNFFYPQQVNQSQYKPKVIITGLQLFGKEPETLPNGEKAINIKNDITEWEQIVLKPNQPVFSIHYTALNYAYPAEGEFAYMLEGLDEDWNYVKNQTSAAYRYLAPGDYVFKVKASNQDNVWFDDYAQIRIKVLPPWYKTWWAYFIYIGLSAAVVFSYIRFKAKQAELRYEIKVAHIQAEKEKELHEKKLSFFTNISHEFRTPLTLIINPIKELFYKDNALTDTASLNIVYRNARRLLSLVDQLLLFRKAESGAGQMQIRRLNIVDVIREVFLCFTQQAKTKNVTYEFLCKADNIEIFADRDKIEIAFYNLVSNALKFVPPGGLVKVIIDEHAGKVNISVFDNGPGIAKADQDKLFTKFYQADRSIQPKSGFGIGLYLVKSFIESHNGSISCESGQGSGTTFTAVLLKGRQHLNQYTIYEDICESSLFLEELAEGDKAVIESASADGSMIDVLEEISSEQKTILIIDDNIQIRQYLCRLFAQDYSVAEAGNGEEGLRLIRRRLPDIVICDVMMPGLNGVELCSHVKEDPELNHIPVILLTASSSPEIKLKGIECGADDYISKPFEKELLLARVAGILKSRNNLQRFFYNEITLKSDNVKISPEYKEFLDRCIHIVEQHLEDPGFGIKTLADEIGMSRSNLYKRIKSISGQSANSFIRFIRLRKAAEIFITTDSTVYETAYQVGIKDLKYFREQFSKLFNMNPSEYIKKYRKPFHENWTVNKDLLN